MVYLPSIVVVSQYFSERRALATGIAVCGSGVGTFIFAPLTNALLAQFAWKGTVLIEAAILLNCIPCGLIFRPLVRSSRKTGGVATSTVVNGTQEHIQSVSKVSLAFHEFFNRRCRQSHWCCRLFKVFLYTVYAVAQKVSHYQES